MTRYVLLLALFAASAAAQDPLARFAAARAAGDVPAMRREADAAIADAPKNPEGYRALATALEAQGAGDVARGRTTFVGVLFLDAMDAWSTAASLAVDAAAARSDLLAAGSAALRAGNGEKGLAATRLLDADPSPESRVLRARLHLLVGDGAAAKDRLSGLIDDPRALGPLAEAAILLGDRALAASAAVAACRTADGSVVDAVFAPLARAWRDGGDPRWPDFLRSLEPKAGTSPFLRWYLADAEYRASKWLGALAGFKTYADAYPNDPLGWQCLALVYPKIGRFEAAEEALDRALELGIDAERAADALRRLTAAAYAAKDYARAVRHQTTLVAWFDDPSDKLDLGVIKLDMRDVEGAAKAYLEVAEGPSTSRSLRGKAWNYLALLKDGRGDVRGFYEAVERSIAVSDDVDARENLACRLIDDGREAEAVPLLERLVTEDPARIRSIYHLARARHIATVLPRKR